MHASIPVNELLQFNSISEKNKSHFRVGKDLINFLYELSQIIFIKIPVLAAHFFIESESAMKSLSLSSRIVMLIIINYPPINYLKEIE